MQLANYINLIGALPYEVQSFSTSKKTWTKYCVNPEFNNFYNNIFNKSTHEISRLELFELGKKKEFEKAVFSIILWGYPRNMRGNSFGMILSNLNALKDLIKDSQSLSEKEFFILFKQVGGMGIGLSTLSKILYFFGITIENYRALILDNRIIKVLQEKKFEELDSLKDIKQYAKSKQYLKYISLVETLGKKFNVKSDQIELFLFLFGNNIKEVI